MRVLKSFLTEATYSYIKIIHLKGEFLVRMLNITKERHMPQEWGLVMKIEFWVLWNQSLCFKMFNYRTLQINNLH